MLRDWEQNFPGRIESIFSSICNVAGSQLADPKLFDFAGLDARSLAAQPLESAVESCDG
jgi:tRNA 2-thiocytidine biosynthesis protein TtcA